MTKAKNDCTLCGYDDVHQYHLATAQEGEHAYTWGDKPHRLVFDLCKKVCEARYEADRLWKTDSNKGWKYWQKRFYDLFDDFKLMTSERDAAWEKLDRIEKVINCHKNASINLDGATVHSGWLGVNGLIKNLTSVLQEGDS